MEHWDAIVIGAGMGGLCAAARLTAACMSPGVAAAAHETATWGRVIVAPAPQEEALWAALLSS